MCLLGFEYFLDVFKWKKKFENEFFLANWWEPDFPATEGGQSKTNEKRIIYFLFFLFF